MRGRGRECPARPVVEKREKKYVELRKIAGVATRFRTIGRSHLRYGRRMCGQVALHLYVKNYSWKQRAEEGESRM